MQFFSSDDPATRIGEAIGSIFAVIVYAGVIGILFWQFFH
jgi:hypothetical protein